jgi:N-acetylglucosamine kinase-like BadF-type ATPase
MSLYLAVDAGGTKTDFVLADDLRQLARVRTGTIKRLRSDVATTSANLDQGLRELAAQTGIAMSDVTRTCIGTAGEQVPLVADWLRESFRARVGGELLLLGDVEIALDAAFPGESGILVLAGTGSNVAGRSNSGAMISAGGWGPVLAEQGSGYRIGLEALRALFLAIDEGESTLLQSAILNFWQLESMEALVAYANGLPAPDFSRLTPTVLQCANHGDAIAQRVLRQQGLELAHLVCLVVRRLQALNQPGWAPAIAFAGSIMENITPVRDALTAAVLQEFPHSRLLDGVIDPVAGALWRARCVAAKQP